MLPIPVLCVTERGMILQANAIAHDFFQMAVLRGTKLQELVPPNSKSSAQKTLLDVYLNSVCTARIANGEEDGTVTVTMLRAPYGYRVVVNDITSSLRAQSKSMAAVSIHSVLQDRAQFITLLGKEVRAPLHAITMGISLIEERKIAELCPDPQQRAILASLDDHCADLQRYCGSILHLVAEVVDMERLRGGLHNFQYAPLDLRAIVFSAKQAAVLAYCSLQKDQSDSPPSRKNMACTLNIDISERFAPQVPMYSVWGDGPLLRQMLTHLYTNALQHTTWTGKVEVGVEWNWCLTGGKEWPEKALERSHYSAPSDCKKALVTFRVWNSDSHIPDEVAMNLFQPFYRRGGTIDPKNDRKGIGLSICQQIAQTAHGGSIAGCSDETGTTFIIELPLYVMSQTTYPPNKPYVPEELLILPPSSVTHSPVLAQKNPVGEEEADRPNYPTMQQVDLLYVEDVSSNRKMLLRSMRSNNVKATWVENGKEALDWLEAGNTCRVVLLDHKMPVMDGEEACKIIKHRYPDLAVVGLTADTEENEIERFKEAGLDKLLLKPIVMQKVVNVVTSYLDGAGLEKALEEGGEQVSPLKWWIQRQSVLQEKGKLVAGMLD